MTSDAKRGGGRRDGGGARLVIVESPAKARTIAGFLGPEYVVESSIGHVRDLPASGLAVDVDDDFEPDYVVPPDKRQTVANLRKALRGADALYLATDEDREGEAIAWHLCEVLRPKVPVSRMVFHEITRDAIERALANPRELDRRLVDAQETRRILDRLVGYEVSPVLWRKLRPKLSAGRVQSAAIRLVVARERERMRFAAAQFHDVLAQVRSEEDGAPHEPFGARLAELGGERIAAGRDFDPETGALRADAGALALGAERAAAVAEAVAASAWTVAAVSERPWTQRPPAPFVTSSLQQEAGRKLRFTAQRTMRAAQSLYEHGYVTYMRTDSVHLSDQALNAARRQARDLYGAEYVPAAPRRYRTRARGAQEAHEAIRPAGDIFRTPDSLRGSLRGDELLLYDLIWKRTVASQMRDATGLRTSVRLEAGAGAEGAAIFAASGKVISFPGFLRAYVEGSDDPDAALDDQERILPPLREGQALRCVAAEARSHETRPPARYTEASLVRELEERGIGRPSTYASIIQTVQSRGYVRKHGSALTPTWTAFAVVNLLEQHFADLVDLEFTARMEADLDRVAEGELERAPWLRRFYFGDPGAEGGGLRQRIDSSGEAIDPRAISAIPLGADGEGREIAVRVGRYGPYVQAGGEGPRASIPDDLPPDELTVERAIGMLRQAGAGDRVVADDPASGAPIYAKSGPNGPYVQLGANEDNGGKPKRASLWPGMTLETVTAEQALELLSYPRLLGEHPESGEAVTALDGRYGPYVRAGKESRSLRDHEHLRTVGLGEALALLREPKRSGRAAQSVLATLGEHPESGAPVELRNGRYGPYVTDGGVNASLPRDRDPSGVTLDEALGLIAEREETLRAQGKDPRAPKQARAPRAARGSGGARRGGARRRRRSA